MKSTETKKLTPAQYWEWRTTIVEMQVCKTQLREAELELKLMQKDAELLAVRAMLFAKTKVESLKAANDASKVEYERFKKVLEDSLGETLSGKMIDEVTYEIKDLPSENQQQVSAK